ncbi:MAG TPA: PSD1 and planctomycete cytochrome C domain-containing protein [Planctomycetota bacterium]|nr:PSD1 and planctomycete cytochrome C domain-containing protein [Planctomycetota bacterium]
MIALLLLLPQADDGLDHFERRIRPVLAERCYGCHSATAKKLKGGLLLDSREGVLEGGDGGPAVVPGDPDRSPLVLAVRWKDEDLRMPPDKPLTPDQISDVEAWVRRGAPMPAGGVVKKPTAGPGDHWAFRPPRDVAPPAVRGPVATPVDAFLLAVLEPKGLSFGPPADRRTLLRRASFDLTGLPPTAEEVDAFLADPAADAYERAVDRLLASPRYGERWGRHWLDVARYADTKGYVYEGREEARFVHSATYRDWVVRAFNEDLPYDRFLALQLAADRLATDRRDLAAQGFLTVGRRFVNNIHDIIDDRIDTVTRGMLGLTVSCARCHDHKFDPIPITDYYALYGVFHASTERAEPLAEPAGAFAAELKKRVDAYETKRVQRTKELLERLRAKTPEYLVAAVDVAKFPTEEFYELLGPDDLKPFIVRRWAAYIDRHRDGPVWSAWHAAAAIPERDLREKFPEWLAAHRERLDPRIAAALAETPASMKDVAARYGRAFAEARKAPRPGDPLVEVLEGPSSPIATPEGAYNEIEWFYDESVRVELGKLQKEIDRHVVESRDAPGWAAYLADRPPQPNPRVFRRGNPAQKGEEVPRRMLSLLGGRVFADGSGRLELARAIASADNPLTARVWVNRVWMHHFGQGLVRTPSDFGLRSEPPTHPELLDWLARRFVADGWSTKKLHRLIVASNAYRQQSGVHPADPEHRLLARFPRRRLDFEQTRDAVLAASGELDLALGGRPADLLGSGRRTLYGFVDRLNLPSLYRVFDYTGADAHNPQRFVTTTPQQALFLMNSPFMLRQARAVAAQAAGSDPDARLASVHRRLFGRAPTAVELARGRAFVGGAPPPAPLLRRASPWSHGYGEVDAAGGPPTSFTVFPHFAGDAWQGGPAWPDPALGWARLTAQGGHAGDDLKRAVIRRWTAPTAGRVSIDGTVAHRHKQGDGIRARIVSSTRGVLGSWTLHDLEADARVRGLPVKAGERIDFVVDCGAKGDVGWDEFTWSPSIRLEQGVPAAGAAETPQEWNAAAEFGPASPAFDPWTAYAQALLVSNEFVFVD